jgi:hypothetical protein
MKKNFKLIGIIAIVAIIGLSFSSCEQPEVEYDNGWFPLSGSSVMLYNKSSYSVTVTINNNPSQSIYAGGSKSFPLSSTGTNSIYYSPKDKVKARRHKIDVTTWYFENK